jgi:hypothetical protein
VFKGPSRNDWLEKGVRKQAARATCLSLPH